VGTAERAARDIDLAQRIGPFAHVFKELRVFDSIPEGERSRYAPDLPRILRPCLATIGD
jgi:hypothetical protein